MPAQSHPLLRLSQITKTFGTIRAVWNLDLEVYPGDFLAIFGPNGAGKTTLLRIIASLTQPTSGTIEFTQKNSSQNRQQVGYVSHQSLLYNELTGFENLLFYARLYGIGNAQDRADEMLAKMGLEQAGDQLVREYSRGMKQRLTLARALLHEPQLLLLDEPYTGLDQHGSRLFTQVLEGLKEEGRTVLLITHNLGEGLALCTRAVIQHRGVLVFQAARQEFEKSEFEKLYFRAVEPGARSQEPGARIQNPEVRIQKSESRSWRSTVLMLVALSFEL
ncbi:heme ABC exporter ATP-binding protein CcmA [Acidobacteria bacterium AH-259-G07]|nr:heme ABC exporter ATP-binding protein CcmA [Acidobacteria bacterium AH-259-G07]